MSSICPSACIRCCRDAELLSERLSTVELFSSRLDSALPQLHSLIARAKVCAPNDHSVAQSAPLPGGSLGFVSHFHEYLHLCLPTNKKSPAFSCAEIATEEMTPRAAQDVGKLHRSFERGGLLLSDYNNALSTAACAVKMRQLLESAEVTQRAPPSRSPRPSEFNTTPHTPSLVHPITLMRFPLRQWPL